MAILRTRTLRLALPGICAGALVAAAGILVQGEVCAQPDAGPRQQPFRFQEQVAQGAEEAQQQSAIPDAQLDELEPQAYSIAPDRLQEVTLELKKKYINRRDVQINVNQRTKQMFVTAPVAVHEEIAVFLAPDLPEEKALPAPKPVEQRALPPADQRVRGTHPLKNVSAEDFELSLARIWNKRATFTTSHDRHSTLVNSLENSESYSFSC